MSKGERHYGKTAVGARLSEPDGERLERFKTQENLTNSEAVRVLVRLALDIVLSGKKVKADET